MAEEFNVDGMLDVYLFENSQLLEKLQEMVLEQKDAECFDEESLHLRFLLAVPCLLLLCRA